MRRILLAGAAIIFIFQPHVYPENCAVEEGNYYLVNAKPVLNVRMSPGETQRIINRIPDGEIVYVESSTNTKTTVAGKEGCWVKVQWRYTRGWAFSAFLKNFENRSSDANLLDQFDVFYEKTKKGIITLNGTRIGEGCECSEGNNSVQIKYTAPVILYITFNFIGNDTASICREYKNGKKVQIDFTLKKLKKKYQGETMLLYTADFQVNAVTIQ